MNQCSIDRAKQAEEFRVTPSFRDNLSFSASMIDPNAMDQEITGSGGYSSAPLDSTAPTVVHHKWGWWSLVAPFIL
jgi:hypothetical protein